MVKLNFNKFCEVNSVVGYIDVGGGMRAVYGAGVLDFCLDEGIEFPYYIGVSAGSANIISHLGGHRDRTLRFYRDYSCRPEYMSLKNWVKNKKYLDLDYIYTTLTQEGGEDPLNFEVMRSHNCDFYIVTTDAPTGKTEYLDYRNIEKNDYYELKASSCIPVVCPVVEKDGREYYDGGLSDPIPVRKAFQDGCDKVVITLTLPKDYHKPHKAPETLYKAVLKKYPESARLMYSMIDKYNADLDYINKLEKEGKVLILSPDDCCGVTTLKHERHGVEALYHKGYEDAGKIKSFLSADTEATP